MMSNLKQVEYLASGALKDVICDLCGNHRTSHMCFHEPDDQSICTRTTTVAGPGGAKTIPICGLAFCVICRGDESEERTRCPLHSSTQVTNSATLGETPLTQVMNPPNTPVKPQTLNILPCQDPGKRKQKKGHMSQAKNNQGNKNKVQQRAKKKRKSLKYKDQHIIAPFEFFVLDNFANMYSENDDVHDAKMTGQITQLHNKRKGTDYFITWDSSTKPSGFDMKHAQNNFKQSDSFKKQLKKARIDFDNSEKAGNPSGSDSEESTSSEKSELPLKQQLFANSKKTASINDQNLLRQISRNNIITCHTTMSQRSSEGVEDSQQSLHDYYAESSSDEENHDLSYTNAYAKNDTNDISDFDSDTDDDNVNDTLDEEDTSPIPSVSWKFEDFNGKNDTGLQPPGHMYDKKGTLRPDLLETGYENIFDCVSKAGGMDHDYFKRLTKNSNLYAGSKLKDGKFIGRNWSNITLGEMIRFHGIILKMSIDPRKFGSYETYFYDSKLKVNWSEYESIPITGMSTWAANVMTFDRFKQIRSAYHPESLDTTHDKCVQIRFTINKLNKASGETFIVGTEISFDEGGVAVRSNYCPVRQYNKDKPAPYRVDCFVTADAHEYFIIHLDIYQGKNDSNVGIEGDHAA